MFIALFSWNFFVFLLYGFDKFLARHRMWRIPELILMGGAFLFGSLGAFAGMQIFHHKTRRAEFVIGVPIAIAVHIVLYVFLKFIC